MVIAVPFHSLRTLLPPRQSMRVYAWVTSDMLSRRYKPVLQERWHARVTSAEIHPRVNLVVERMEYGILVPVRRLFSNKMLFYLFIQKVRLPSLP